MPKIINKTKIIDQRSLKWVLTIHGANPDGSCPILKLLKRQFQKDEYPVAAVAFETGKQGIHPHWQIYFETSKRCKMKQKMSSLLGEDISFHLQVAKGTLNANLRYVYAVDKPYQIGWLHYVKGHNPPKDYDPYPMQDLIWFRNNMRPWQRWVTEKVTSRADRRDIVWIWEPVGNTGKSYLAKYLHYFHGAILTGGSSEDMKHAIARWKQITNHYPVIIIVNLARIDNISPAAYKTLESIKDAFFFSGKYDSCMVASLHTPHVVVFANKLPDTTAMSKDRWKIFKIDPKTYQLVPKQVK